MLIPVTVCSVCVIIPIATILSGIFLIRLLRMPLATIVCGTSLIPLPLVLPLAVTVCGTSLILLLIILPVRGMSLIPLLVVVPLATTRCWISLGQMEQERSWLDLSCSICPKGLQCSASQDLFASICPKDPHAPHSPDENPSECLWNLPDSKVDQSTIENPWACLQRLPCHIAYLSQILHATRTPLGYVLLLEVPHWLSSAKSSEKTIKTEPDLILGRNCHLLLQSIDSIEDLSYLQNANISSNAVKFEATISLIPCFLPPVHKRSHISLPIHKSSDLTFHELNALQHRLLSWKDRARCLSILEHITVQVSLIYSWHMEYYGYLWLLCISLFIV